MKKRNLFFILLSIIVVLSCNQESKKEENTAQKLPIKKIPAPQFNADSAYSYVMRQVEFGERVPNTTTHTACGDYLVQSFNNWGAEVIEQTAQVQAYNGTALNMRNIIAQFQPKKANRIALMAHWDTRPYADQCEDESRIKEPIAGANDGASGVGILMEIARLLQAKNPQLGVDIILFDTEDYGAPEWFEGDKEDTWCLGSQYWAKNPHKPSYYARFGILLDMVGSKDAVFTQEGTSRYFAPSVLKKVWGAAARLGYSGNFLYEETNPIIDDHLYVNRIANIPTIDIIHYNHGSKHHFGDYWHTHNDNMDIIDKKSLKVVGQTLLETIFSER